MVEVASKRYRAAAEQVDRAKRYKLEEAVAVLQGLPAVKFDETVELHCHLEIDPKQTEFAVRGTTVLPHGTGSTRRVIVFGKGETVREAEAAGADAAGGDELIAKVLGGWMEFDVAVATPSMMKDVSKLGKVLGPRGLMPSPKVGTVTDDVAKAIKEVKGGRIEFKMDALSNLHIVAGKRSFAAPQLVENIRAIVEAVWRVKPAGLKGRYVLSATVTTTMGPPLHLALDDLHQERAEE